MRKILSLILFIMIFTSSSIFGKEKGVWTHKKINNQACAIYQFPVSEKGDYTKRGQVIFFVTKDKGAVYVRADAGYTFETNKYIKVTIDGSNFQFFEDGDSAWSMKDDRIIIDAMKAGKQMIIVGYSSRGTQTTDTYSLIGFTKAITKLNESC